MKLADIFSRHPRGEISAHADGELAPDRLGGLEAHLSGCERCRTELGELLAVRSALRDLPQAAAPRSFTLTPAMAERKPAPVASRTTPSFVAMRIAGAGFAAVLAVVVMLDAGGIVDDTRGGGSDESTTLGFLNIDGSNGDAEMYETLAGDAAAPAGGSVADEPAPGAEDGDGSTDGFQSGPDSGEQNPAIDPQLDNFGQERADATTTPGDDISSRSDAIDGDTAALESGDGAPAAFTPDDDGLSSLLIIEIGLATIALIAIGGSFAMRRREDSE